jgi:transposase-like protein
MKGMVPGKATGEQMRWNQYARPVGDSWRVDETYIKVKGQWGYL